MSGIVGHVDALDGDTLSGWAQAPGRDRPLQVSAWLDDRRIGSGSADLHRPDLGGDVGYRLALDAVPSPADLDRGAFRVEAAAADGEHAILPVPDTLRAHVAEQAMIAHMARLPMERVMRAVATEMIRRRREQPFARLTRDITPDELSPFLMPVGQVSTDGAVVVGRNGHLFLTAGSNDLVGQYGDTRSDEEVDAAASPWTALFARRADALAARGVAYRQIVIPEKSSILPECFPVPIRTPTRLFARLEEQLATATAAAAATYVPLLAPLRDHPDRTSLYLGVDTHLAAKGMVFVLGQVLSSLGLAMPDLAFDDVRVGIGDLGSRFPGAPLCAVQAAPRPSALEPYERRLEEVERISSSHLNGSRLVTRNPDAAIDARVLVFGNSYFGLGDYMHGGSYWMARLFTDYHFHWTPEIDLAVVDAIRPDIVIGQSNERFLPVVPGR